MKSLEIVNYKISLFEKDKQGFTALSWFQLNGIKQDLEVLEIIKKKKVDFVHLNNYLFLYDKNEEVLEKYNKYCFYQNELTLEELLKLKQWLENNND